MIIPVENQLKYFCGIIGNSLFLRTVIMNYSQIVISIVTLIYEAVWLWCHTYLFNKLCGGFYVLRLAWFLCFGILVWRIFLFAFFFLFFTWAHCWFFASMSWTTTVLLPIPWADRCIVPMDISWSQSIKLSSKLKDSLNTRKFHSHGLGELLNESKWVIQKRCGKLEKLWIQNINFPVNKKSFTFSALKNFIFFLFFWELKEAFSFKTEKWKIFEEQDQNLCWHVQQKYET